MRIGDGAQLIHRSLVPPRWTISAPRSASLAARIGVRPERLLAPCTSQLNWNDAVRLVPVLYVVAAAALVRSVVVSI